MNRDTKFSYSGGETNMSTWQIFLLEKIGPQICNISTASLRIIRRRSSRQEVFNEKGVLRNFTKFTGKHLCQSFVFSCEFCEISKNTFFLQNTSGGCFCRRTSSCFILYAEGLILPIQYRSFF